MDTFLIVDGHNLLFQMYFGMPNKIYGRNNKQIQGTLGFIGALLKIIKKVKPTYILVVFDSETENLKKKIDGEYKSNRVDYNNVVEEENPFSQLNDIYIALDHLNIKHFESGIYEADDIIANYTIEYMDKYLVIVSSFDSDFFQLINDNVNVLRYRGDKTVICDRKYVMDKYSILPSDYVLFKALVGDNSDNVKGIPYIGVKTAAKIINEYKDMNGIINNLTSIKSVRIRKSLEDNLIKLKNNYSIIQLIKNDFELYNIECLLNLVDDSIKTNFVLKSINLI